MRFISFVLRKALFVLPLDFVPSQVLLLSTGMAWLPHITNCINLFVSYVLFMGFSTET